MGRLILKIYKMDFPLRTKAPRWAQHVCEDCPVLGFLTGVEAFFPQWLIVHIQNPQSSNSKWQVLFKHVRRNIPHCSSYSLLFQPSLNVSHLDNRTSSRQCNDFTKRKNDSFPSTFQKCFTIRHEISSAE